MRLAVSIFSSLLLSTGLSAHADEPARILCDPSDPANHCPGPKCLCVPDSLEVNFLGPGGPTLEYAQFTDGMEIDMHVVLAAETPGIQGFVFGVAHDPLDLEVLSAEIGPDLADIAQCELCSADRFTRDVQTCGADPACAPESRTDGGGWIFSAILFDFTQGPVELPLGRHRVASARYRLLRDVGTGGTKIRFSDRLAYKGMGPWTYNLTIDGVSRVFGSAVDGIVRRAGPGADHFRRGDANGDERINVTDAVWIIFSAVDLLAHDVPCVKALDANDDGRADLADGVFLLLHLFSRGATPPPPGLQCGADGTVDDLPCSESPCP